MGLLDGVNVGLAVTGLPLGLSDEVDVVNFDGLADGLAVTKLPVGLSDGVDDVGNLVIRLADGLAVGLSVGDRVKLAVGLAVGLSVGDRLGLAVGQFVTAHQGPVSPVGLFLLAQPEPLNIAPAKLT